MRLQLQVDLRAIGYEIIEVGAFICKNKMIVQ